MSFDFQNKELLRFTHLLIIHPDGLTPELNSIQVLRLFNEKEIHNAPFIYDLGWGPNFPTHIPPGRMATSTYFNFALQYLYTLEYPEVTSRLPFLAIINPQKKVRYVSDIDAYLNSLEDLPKEYLKTRWASEDKVTKDVPEKYKTMTDLSDLIENFYNQFIEDDSETILGLLKGISIYTISSDNWLRFLYEYFKGFFEITDQYCNSLELRHNYYYPVQEAIGYFPWGKKVTLHPKDFPDDAIPIPIQADLIKKFGKLMDKLCMKYS